MLIGCSKSYSFAYKLGGAFFVVFGFIALTSIFLGGGQFTPSAAPYATHIKVGFLCVALFGLARMLQSKCLYYDFYTKSLLVETKIAKLIMLSAKRTLVSDYDAIFIGTREHYVKKSGHKSSRYPYYYIVLLSENFNRLDIEYFVAKTADELRFVKDSASWKQTMEHAEKLHKLLGLPIMYSDSVEAIRKAAGQTSDS